MDTCGHVLFKLGDTIPGLRDPLRGLGEAAGGSLLREASRVRQGPFGLFPLGRCLGLKSMGVSLGKDRFELVLAHLFVV